MENGHTQLIPQFYVIIVLYNEYVDNTLMYKLLLHKGGTRLFFVDNSTIQDIRTFNKQSASKYHCEYIDMNGNAGLSIAYNAAISKIRDEVNEFAKKWIVIFDQDTPIPSNFMDSLICELKANNLKEMIYVPLVFDRIGVLSPCGFSGLRFKRIKYINLSEKSSFINSGMCIPLSFFENCSYDKSIFLDFVDHDFVKTIRKLYGNVFKLMPSISLKQNFSGSSKEPQAKVLHRYKIYCKDAKIFYKKWSCFYFGSMMFVFLRGVKLSFLYRDFVFIRIFFNRAACL